MPSTAPLESSVTAIPEMLTVPEAARRLRIGRTLAYQLAARFLQGEPGGIPTIRLGGVLRIPRSALEDFVRFGPIMTLNDLRAAADAAIDDYLGTALHHSGEPKPTSVARTLAITQLSLLDVD